MNLKGKCYLVWITPTSWVQRTRIKRRFLNVRGVYRVTDHGSHIKVNTTRPLPKMRGTYAKLVKDRTTHYDVRYWDFATDVARYIIKRKDDAHRPLAVLLHYLCNLLDTPEAELLDMIAAQRRYIDKWMTDEMAHGWELQEKPK